MDNVNDPIVVAEVYAYRGDKDKAFEWLERAYEQRDRGLCEIKAQWRTYPGLQQDPRWSALLKKLNFPID